MYQYIHIQYSFDEKNTIHDGYQEISGGAVLRNTDMDGNTVDFYAHQTCESWVVDANPETPVWAPIPPPPVEEEEPVIDDTPPPDNSEVP